MLLNKDDSLLLLVDVQEKLIPAVLNSKALIKRCAWLLKLAARLHIPVLVSEQYPQGLGATDASLQELYNPNNCIKKTHFSCMEAPAFREHLQEFTQKQIILIGMETHVCILQTAMQLQSADYQVFVVVDAVSSRNEVDLKYGLKRMKQQGIHLITAEMVFFEWIRQAGTPEFKQLSKEFLQG